MLLIRETLLWNKNNAYDILIENNIIRKIGRNLIDKEKINKKDVKIIDGKNKLSIPGLINTHTHVPMTLFRGVADDIPLSDWLNNYIWKMEAKLDKDMVYVGTLLGAIEMIKSGTTTFNDMYFHIDGILKGVLETGIRAYLSYGMIDLFDKDRMERELKDTEKTIKKIKKINNAKVKSVIGPHAPYTCSKELLMASHEMAREYSIPLHIHMNETLNEVKTIKERTGMRPFEYLNSLGFFDGVNVIAAHCVHLSDNEINIIKNKKITVSHNPISNLKLASGIAPIPKLMENNILITLGTDGCGSNNNLNLFEEIKTTSLIHKGVSLNSTVIPGEESFKFATLNGAHALNLNSGMLSEGHLADVVLIDVKKSYLIPNENLKSHLVYSFNGAVDTVLIDGDIVLDNGKIITINEERVYEMAERAYSKLIN